MKLPECVWCTLLSVSNVTECVNISSNCTDSVFLNLQVENNSLNDKTERIFASINTITFNDGETKNAYVPINITITKSPVEIDYELTNPFAVNYNPYEVVIDTSWMFCESNGEYLGDENDFDYSCNKLYHKNDSSEAVPYSSGFCCSCPMSTIFFGSSSTSIRGGCSIFSSSRTAHCMRYHPTWYTGYTIGKSKAKYSITINTEKLNASGETIKSTTSLNESY